VNTRILDRPGREKGTAGDAVPSPRSAPSTERRARAEPTARWGHCGTVAPDCFFLFFELATRFRITLFRWNAFPNDQSLKSELCAELQNARREGLGNLAKTGASNVIHGKSIETAPVRLVEGVVGIHPELQAHAFPGQIE
jgi:hypothetical protein